MQNFPITKIGAHGIFDGKNNNNNNNGSTVSKVNMNCLSNHFTLPN